MLGTAGNTGIGLALVGKALGYKVLAVMPNNQAKEKEQTLALFGAQVKLVDAVPFANQNHFYHTGTFGFLIMFFSSANCARKSRTVLALQPV